MGKGKASKGKMGYGNGLLMTQKEVTKRGEADKQSAQRGMMGEIGKARACTARTEVQKLYDRSDKKPLTPAPPDPHADLVKNEQFNPNEPSVESAEPNLVQIQRARQHFKGQD